MMLFSICFKMKHGGKHLQQIKRPFPLKMITFANKLLKAEKQILYIYVNNH